MYKYTGKIILLIIALINLCACQEIFVEKENRTCSCVPYYQCLDEPLHGELVFIDIRQESECMHYLDICCFSPNNTVVVSEIKHSKQSETIKGCGYQDSGSFLWTLALFYQATSEDIPLYKCDASLIHQQVVITAAHCVKDQGTWFIKSGDARRTVKKIILHPDYNSTSLHNDLVLLILSDPIESSDKLNTICLPPSHATFDQIHCMVGSWSNSFNATSDLKPLNVSIHSNEECLKALTSTKLGMSFQLHRNFICAGGEDNKDKCTSTTTEGSPLVCPIANQPRRYYQAGIASWDIGCEQSNIPAVYVNVGVYREWIDHKIVENGFIIDV